MDGVMPRESLRLEERDSSHLFIWFGGFFEPLVSQHHFDVLGLSNLNLLDSNRDWYVGGIAGHTSCEEETVSLLTQLAHGRPVICAGQSSGGYAAIRYGHALDAALIVAISPQTGVRTPSTRSAGIAQLDTLYALDPRQHPIAIHIARSEAQSAHQTFWGDHLHALAMAHVANVTIHQHPYDSHVLTNYLGREQSFLQIVRHEMEWHGLLS